jgi:GPH family glycoside/pentoside/hexuronide:cation symporter
LQGSVKPHFIRYYIDHDLTGFFAITANFMALYMGLTMLAGVAGVVFANRLFLKRQWCKVTVMKLALLGSLVPNALLLVVPRQWWEASLLLIMAANFFHMMFIPLLFSAIPDTVDYGLKTIGRGAMAMFFAGQLFALKMGISVGGGSAGWILGMFGYEANVEQTERSLFGIKLAFAGAPLVAAVIVVILLQFYKLKKGWEHKESVIGPGVEPVTHISKVIFFVIALNIDNDTIGKCKAFTIVCRYQCFTLLNTIFN